MNSPIILTSAALKAISDYKPEGIFYLKIGLKGAGCAGYQYILDTITLDKEDQWPIPKNICWNQKSDDENINLNIAVDYISVQYLKGTIIDFVKNGLQVGFTFTNPNAKSTCGCGSSFSA